MSEGGSTDLWDALAATLVEEEARLFAGVPADNPELIDSAKSIGAPTLVSRDQRLAAYAAVGWGMTAGRAGVLALQAGPGFANAHVGLLEAASLRQPLIVVATSNPADGVGRGGFQEYDVAVRRPELFVWQHVIASGQQLEWAVRSAVATAEGAEPGPVLLAVSGDLRPAVSTSGRPERWLGSHAVPSPEVLRELAQELSSAEQVVIILGGGSKAPGARQVYEALAQSVNARVFVTASGRGAFSEVSPRFGGLAGLYASKEARDLLVAADLVLVVGSALEETARWGWGVERVKPTVRIDRSPTALERGVIHCRPVVGDALLTAKALLGFTTPRAIETGTVTDIRKPRSSAAVGPVTAPDFWTCFRDVLLGESPRSLVICQENGLADLWGYYLDAFSVPDWAMTLVPGEQTAMGFGLGAALGAEATGSEVVAVAGDGAVEANLSWLLTVSERKANVLLIVLRNRRFGWPALSRGEEEELTALRVERDLVGFARSMGFVAEKVDTMEALASTLRETLGVGGPRLVEVEISGTDAIPGATDWSED